MQIYNPSYTQSSIQPIERIARILARQAWIAQIIRPDGRLPVGDQREAEVVEEDEFVESRWRDFADVAREILLCLHRPTHSMLDAGLESAGIDGFSLAEVGLVYAAMIETAAQVVIPPVTTGASR